MPPQLSSELGNGLAHWLRLMLAFMCPLSIVLISYCLQLKIEYKVVIVLLRSMIQLLFLGYVLLGLIYSMDSPLLVVTYLVLMVLVGALESTSRQLRTYSGHYWDALAACAVGGGSIAIFGVIVVFHPQPWWLPQVMVPVGGMLIGNSVSGPAVSVDRLLAEVAEKTHETEIRLSLGASRFEAILPALRSSVQSAMLPNLNQLAVMGLVSIPGMMTGQILGGAAPVVAAEYQICILFLLVGSSAVSIGVAVLLAVRHAVFDSQQRLSLHQVQLRDKTGIDSALYQLFLSLGRQCVRCVAQHNASMSLPDESDSADRRAQKYSPVAATDENMGIELTSVDSGERKGTTSGGDSAYPMTSAVWRLDENPESPSLQYLELDEPLDHRQPELLCIRALNVLCGEAPLFGESDGLSLGLRRGERVTLEGPSGLGKTRLLRAIAQLDAPLFGQMSLPVVRDLEKLYRLHVNNAEWRRHVIYIPQSVSSIDGSPKDLLIECLSYHCRAQSKGGHRLLRSLDGECGRMERELLLSEGKLSQAWALLSGGERQRAVIACALLLASTIVMSDCGTMVSDSGVEPDARETSADPEHFVAESGEASYSHEHEDLANYRPYAILLLDEPTAACDAVACAAVERALIASGVACIVVTHDEQQACRIAHKRVTLIKDVNVA